ncbi:hypothetical protein JHK86_055567 [Glycine max]|nr:hypothetical protein JHK86_055567 [Glycine max]
MQVNNIKFVPLPASHFGCRRELLLTVTRCSHHRYRDVGEVVAFHPARTAALRELRGLEELFQAYNICYYTAAKIVELGFTESMLMDMKDEELDDMMNNLS